MSNAIFPALIQGWPLPKRQFWSTLTNPAESGYETRVALRSLPLYEWDIPLNLLRPADLGAFWGFYAARAGSFDPFLFSDQMDNFALGAALGVGDGHTTVFQFVRSLGGLFVEPRYEIQETPTAPVIYLNGVVQAGTAYSIAYLAAGTLTFAVAPAEGVAVTADFYFYYRVKFKDDSQELQAENAAYGTAKKITLAQVRA